MTHTSCGYIGDRDDVLIAYLYEEIDPAVRTAFDAHVATCLACRDELAALGGVRDQLGRWHLPDHQSPTVSRLSPAAGAQAPATSHQLPATGRSWWREIPAWAQVAAALLFLGVAAGVANFDARFDRGGLSVKTGWSTRADTVEAPASASAVGGSAPWQSDLAALEARLRADLRASNASATSVASGASRAGRATPLDAEALGRVRALIGESERRQQRELALRVAEIMRDVNTQRQADLVKIDRSLGQIQNNTGVEVMRQRELLNYVLRTSQRQQ